MTQPSEAEEDEGGGEEGWGWEVGEGVGGKGTQKNAVHASLDAIKARSGHADADAPDRKAGWLTVEARWEEDVPARMGVNTSSPVRRRLELSSTLCDNTFVKQILWDTVEGGV